MAARVTLRPRLGFVLSLVMVLGLGSLSALADYVTGTQPVEGDRSTPAYTDGTTTWGPFGWHYKYRRSFDGKKFTKDVEIDFVFDADLNYTDADKDAYKKKIEKNIEGVWNDKFAIKDNKGTWFKLTVDVTLDAPFDQTVKVHTNNAVVNMLNWNATDSANVNAHEFGHMLGLFDEYVGGAVDKIPNPTLSNDGLMGLGGAQNAKYVMYPRYYQQYLDYMNSLNPTGRFELVAVPLPAVIWLFPVGAGMIGVIRWRNSRKAA